ncbi:MAG: tetraacyldisaccharide 4'-kinase, partial [Alphaproteobacteria bacterium]
MKAPGFWYPDNPRAPLPPLVRALAPLSRLYARIDNWKRGRITPARARIPVICVGNLTVGGAGKTPVVLMLTRMLSEKGFRPVILTRGYGGVAIGPEQVDLNRHKAEDVGDEALLLAQVAPTVVSANRVEGARAAAELGADLIVMDDGYQNPSLVKDASLLVVDGEVAFGNGRIFPQGPLRETPEQGCARADAVIIMGGSKKFRLEGPCREKPTFRARLVPDAGSVRALKGRSYFAFAGIGRPRKFFDTARAAGLDVKQTRSYPDHHPLDDETLDVLEKLAAPEDLALLTTAKDAVRLPPESRSGINVLHVHAEISEAGKLLDLIREKTGLSERAVA